MRKAIVSMLAAFAVVACSKDKTPEPSMSGTAMGSRTDQQPMITAEEVRTTLIQERPTSRENINNLTILSDGATVTLRGTVDDEEARSEIVHRVRSMPNVRSVRDELQVMPRAATAPTMTPSPMDMPGTTTTTGATESKADAVRRSMEQARPQSVMVIENLTITEEGQDEVKVAGNVPNEETKKALVQAAKDTPGVKNVKDDIKVDKKQQKAKQQP